MGFKKILLLAAISIGLIALSGTTGCGAGQVRYGDIGADLPTAAEPGDEGSPTIPAGTSFGALSINSVFPAAGSRGVILGTSASVTFDISLLASSIPGNVSVFMVGPVTNISAPIKSIPGPLYATNVIPGTSSLDESGKIVTFTADDEYEDCSIFQIVVAGGADGVQGADGAQLAEDFASQFMSACPAMLNMDVEGGFDMGYSGNIDGDNLYIGAGVYAFSGYSYGNVYKPLVEKIDASAGLGSSEWASPYIPANGNQSFPNEVTAVDIIVMDEVVATAGYERGLFSSSSWNAYGWLQGLDPATGAGLGGDGMSLPPINEMYCKGMAQSPVTGDLMLTCHTPDSIAPIVSYIWNIAPDGSLQGLGEVEVGNNQGYNRGAFDSSGNFYVTLTTFRRYWDLNYESYLGLGVFDAVQLEEITITPPSEFAVYTDAYSNGTDVAVAVENGEPVFYVTGYIDSSQGGTLDIDTLLVKFDAEGNILWSITYTGLGVGEADVFNAVAVDDDGNVYVTGFRTREEIDWDWKSDMILAKYSSDGVEQFTTSYKMGDYGTSDDSVGNDVFLNADGEIFVVGGVFNGAVGGPGGQDFNIAVWRYDNDGNSGGVF